MTVVETSHAKAAIWTECEEKGLAYCKARAEVSFGSRRRALLEWIGIRESQVRAEEQATSQALEKQREMERAAAARKTARRALLLLVLGLGITLAVLTGMSI